MIKKIFQSALYILAILCIMLLTAFGGSWLYEALREQISRMIS
ncbi:hypothetical protein SAMN05428977_10664 [Nitrosomonas sp. Nm166]|nr:hypothetical protein SAMN05428977_10664 [Nitrosomonas sp. Nm166]